MCVAYVGGHKLCGWGHYFGSFILCNGGEGGHMSDDECVVRFTLYSSV